MSYQLPSSYPTSLSLEIYESIFAKLTSNELAICARTSRGFVDIARRSLYRQISICIPEDEDGHTENILDTLCAHPHILFFVRKLCIWFSEPLSLQPMVNLFFPLLHTLILKGEASLTSVYTLGCWELQLLEQIIKTQTLQVLNIFHMGIIPAGSFTSALSIKLLRIHNTRFITRPGDVFLDAQPTIRNLKLTDVDFDRPLHTLFHSPASRFFAGAVTKLTLGLNYRDQAREFNKLLGLVGPKLEDLSICVLHGASGF